MNNKATIAQNSNHKTLQGSARTGKGVAAILGDAIGRCNNAVRSTSAGYSAEIEEYLGQNQSGPTLDQITNMPFPTQ